MNELAGKNILVGVTGGIAAYKVVEVVSRFKKMGAEVRVVMTRRICRTAYFSRNYQKSRVCRNVCRHG